jgi:hypothetical protein
LEIRFLRTREIESFDSALALLLRTCARLDQHEAMMARARQCWAEMAFVQSELGAVEDAPAALERAVRLPVGANDYAPEAAPYLLLRQGRTGAAVAAFAKDVARARGQLAEQERNGLSPWWERYRTARLELGLGQALRTGGRHREAIKVLQSSEQKLARLSIEVPSVEIERRLGRARSEFVEALAMTGSRREPAALVAGARAWFARARDGQGR